MLNYNLSKAIISLHSSFKLLRYITNSVIHPHAKNEINICWKCGELLPALEIKFSNYFQRSFCHCLLKTILPPNLALNYFEILESPLLYDVDITYLKRQYIELQRNFHPDKFTLCSNQEQEFAKNHSSIITNSYNTLLNPFDRSVYILKLEGFNFESYKLNLGTEFLIKMFELNERLEEGLNKEELGLLKKKYQNLIKECYASISLIFNDNQFKVAMDVLGEIQYYKNIIVMIESDID